MKDLGNIARYNIKTGTWHPLPKLGLNAMIHALAVYKDDVFVGGQFIQTGDGTMQNLGFITRFNTTKGTWHVLPNQGLNGAVRAFKVSDGSLYVGGWFSETGDKALKNLGNIARFDIKTEKWYQLPNKGLYNAAPWDATVDALEVNGNNLYVGVSFNQTGDANLKELGNIARFDLTTNKWHKMPNKGLEWGHVYAMAAVGDDLFVGGEFTENGDGTLDDLWFIVSYDAETNTWHEIPNGGFNKQVWKFETTGGCLYVGGEFSALFDYSLKHLGRLIQYDPATETWHAPPNRGIVD